MNTPGSGSGFPGAGGPSEHDPSWDEEVRGLLDGERVRAAAEQRRRDRWQRERLTEQVTIDSALRGALGAAVVLHLRAGTTLGGTVVVVGTDVVGVAIAGSDRTTWVALGAVAAVELPGDPRRVGEPGWQPTLAEVVEELRAEGAPVTVLSEGGHRMRGEVVAAGSTVTLWDRDRGRHLVLDLAAVVSIG